MARGYRADQVGSLLRPPGLLAARAGHAQGGLGIAELRRAEDQVIQEALELQRQIGLDVFTDGEFRRGGGRAGLGGEAPAVDPGQRQ